MANYFAATGVFFDRAQNWSADQTFLDNIGLIFGTGADARVSYNGTHLIINPLVVGSGNLVLGTGEAGTTLATGVTVRSPDVTTGGAGNIAGSDLTVGPGLGTGTGDVGRLIVSLPIVAAAGDNIQTRAERLAFDMVGSSTVLTIAAAQALTISTAAGDLTIDPTASLNVTLTTADADAFDLSDGTTSYYIIDTSTTVDGIFAHTFDASNTTIASGASARFGLVLLQPHTITYTGTTQVTDPNLFSTSFWIRTGTVAGDTATVTIDNRSTATFDGPTEGANVSLTTSTVLHLKDSVGTPTNSIGLRISGVVVGVTSDAQIALDFDSAPTIAAVADRVALNAAEIAAGDVRLAVQSEAGGVVYVGNDTVRAALPAAAAATNISLAADNDFQQDTSSIRYKGNVVDYELAGSALLRSLRPRSFDWLLPETPVHFLHDHGFIAEEVWEIAPYLVNLDFENKPYSLRYDLFAVPLVAGWKDHDARLTTLEDDEALFARIEQYVNNKPEARARLRVLVD